MRLLAGLMVVALLAAVVAELALPRLVEAGVERTSRQRTDGAAEITADVEGRPALPALVGEGRVERLTLRLREVDGREITVGRVELTLEGLELDRGSLLQGKIEVTGLASGTVLIEVDEEELAAALGVDVDLAPGMFELAERAMELATPAGESVRIPVPQRLLPCEPEARMADGTARLTCHFDEVPDVIVRSAN